MKDSLGRRAAILTIVMLMLILPIVAQQAQPDESNANMGIGNNSSNGWKAGEYELELRRIQIEEERTIDMWWAARFTAVSIVGTILIGFASLFLQARTAHKLKQQEALVAFQLKTAEILMNSKSSQAAKEKAAALRRLFPEYVSEDFVNAFKKSLKLPGIAYQEKKLELFKAIAAKLDDRKEIFKIYATLYSDEELTFTDFGESWKAAFPDDAAWVDDLTDSVKKDKRKNLVS